MSNKNNSINNANNANNRDNFQAKSKLKSGVNISIKTTMIAALAIFEEYFREEIDDSPEKWEEARAAILDKGHDCMSIAQNHFNRFNITFKDVHVDFRRRS